MSAVVVEPIKIVVTRHVCPFCRRSRSRPGPAKRHIARCWKNPAVRGCKSCVFFSNNVCKAGFNIERGLVTDCTRWKPSETS